MKKLYLVLLSCTGLLLSGGELSLVQHGKSAYQIVLPDQCYDRTVDYYLNVTARQLAHAFKTTTGAKLPIVREKQAGSRPGIYLGDTQKLRQIGVNLKELSHFQSFLVTRNGDIFIAGRDRHKRGQKPRYRANFYQYILGTVKGAVSFMEDYLGTRFFLPGEIGTEYAKRSTVLIPDNMQKKLVPQLDFALPGGTRRLFYDYAIGYYGEGELFSYGGHSYYDAIPKKIYGKTHPEYYSLVNGRRLSAANDIYYGNCLSNPAVQKLVYQEILRRLDAGSNMVEVGVTDGYVPCQCPQCQALFGVADPGEKIWILHRKMAERLLVDRPGKSVQLIAYGPTKHPPKTFKKFPPNVMVELSCYAPQDFAEWQEFTVPLGFTVYIYNWGFYQTQGFTPKTSHTFCAQQAKLFCRNNVRGIYRCGFGNLFGLEGPAYYVYGKVIEVPQRDANKLLNEFCQGSFKEASGHMTQFFQLLYQRFDELPEVHYYEKSYMSQPFTWLPLAYSWDLLKKLQKNLTAAEAQARDAKVKKRLELVRAEFDYLYNLVSIMHFYHTYKLQPCQELFTPLANLVEQRNKLIASYYQPDGKIAPFPGWPEITLFQSPDQRRLKQNGRMAAILHAPFNWDIATLRAQKLLPGLSNRQMKIYPAAAAVSGTDFTAQAWSRAPWQNLRGIALGPIRDQSRFKIIYDSKNLYVGIETDLPGNRKFTSYGPDGPCWNADCLELMLDPWGNREKYFHFMFNPTVNSQYESATGLISDPLHPLFNRTDVHWNGQWSYENRVHHGKWYALITVPFATLQVSPPQPGATWVLNVGRESYTVANRDHQPELSLWSPSLESGDFHDRNSFGEAVFQ